MAVVGRAVGGRVGEASGGNAGRCGSGDRELNNGKSGGLGLGNGSNDDDCGMWVEGWKRLAVGRATGVDPLMGSSTWGSVVDDPTGDGREGLRLGWRWMRARAPATVAAAATMGGVDPVPLPLQRGCCSPRAQRRRR
uniref:Uncharacterized protein n=1 Tax=Oryza sativa subsp. japonica TaxID=39947 RepID=Q6Z7F8_ORYSJ|nr:hypothetical protein [Oryza sativa Japonica Group]BAD15810.1 hypothetical protein [Oryza sativa Japonica Group]